MPSPAVLSALARVSSLTKLELNCKAVEHWYMPSLGSPDSSPHTTAQQPAASRAANNPASKLAGTLSGLHQLRCLNLHWANISTPYDNNPLWRGLSGLIQLTSLTTTYTAPHEANCSSCYTPAYSPNYDGPVYGTCYYGGCCYDELPAIHLHLACKHNLAKLVVLPVDGRLFGLRRPPLRPHTQLQALTELVAPTAVIEGELRHQKRPTSPHTFNSRSPSPDSWPEPTYMRSVSPGEGGRHSADHKYGRVLPCSLRKLELSSIDDMGHLLQLTGLTSLALHMAVEVPVGQLLRLTALGSLVHLQLSYCAFNLRRSAHQLPDSSMVSSSNDDRAFQVLQQHAAQAWAILPLRHLSIDTHTWRGNRMLLAEVLPHLQ